jgi:hypothetical protein
MNFREMALCAVVLFGVTTPAAGAEEELPGKRWEVTLNLYNWDALADLRPVAGGSFDTVGVGFAGAIHWPVKRFKNSELMLGAGGGILTSESSAPGQVDDLLVRQLFVSPSVKWIFGDKHHVSLDAGISYHLLDIAEVDSGYGATGLTFEYFQKNTTTPFVGITWDISAGRTEMVAAFTLGLKVHFVDFGTARDEDFSLPPTLGPNAGKLDGTMIVLQLGSAAR